jgi:hypothetical protein
LIFLLRLTPDSAFSFHYRKYTFGANLKGLFYITARYVGIASGYFVLKKNPAQGGVFPESPAFSRGFLD